MEWELMMVMDGDGRLGIVEPGGERREIRFDIWAQNGSTERHVMVQSKARRHR